MGHIQPPTPIHCDNNTATGIANNTVKKHRSRSMEMRFFWVADQVALNNYDVQWHPGQENLADYFSKHHEPSHHQHVRPWYVHTPQSPRELPRAAAPSTVRGCAGTLAGGYLRSAPLPRVTRTARAAHVTHDVASVRSDTVHAALHVALSSATSMLAAVRATSLVPSNHGLLRAS